jgi:hypothetical protein
MYNVKITIFRDVTPCSLVDVYQYFGGTSFPALCRNAYIQAHKCRAYMMRIEYMLFISCLSIKISIQSCGQIIVGDLVQFKNFLLNLRNCTKLNL